MFGSLVESQYSSLEVTNIVTSLVSLICILFVLLLMVSVGVFGYKKKSIAIFSTISVHKLSFYIISFIFVSELFRMIGHLLPVPSSSLPSFYSDLSCRPGAFFKLFGSISTFLWMNITSYFVYKLLLYPHKFDKFYIRRIKRRFHCISWPIALAISIIPLVPSEYTMTMARSDGPWCFINTRTSAGMTIAFFCYYLWLMVCWIIIIVVYIAIGKLLLNDYKKAKKYNTDSINIRNHNNIITKVPTIQRLQYFPLIFIFCWFWEILSISYNRWSSDNLYIIKCLQSIFTNLYGAFNALLFVYVIYNFNSNSVTHRNPKTIGIKNKKKKSRRFRRRRKQKTKASKTDTNVEEDGAIAVTTTHTNELDVITNNNNNNNNNDEDISGLTVSLGVGNISVMSPTSMSDSDSQDDDSMALMNLNDNNETIHNVTIGYNEDDSDEYYSEDRNSGNVGIIELTDDRMNNETEKTDRAGFSLLRNESENTVNSGVDMNLISHNDDP